MVGMAGSKADSNFYRVIGTVEGFAELKTKQQMPVQSREAVYGSKADRKCFGGRGFWEGICGTKTKTANARTEPGSSLWEQSGQKVLRRLWVLGGHLRN